MQAIILAAGMGRRLGEHTKNNTKCMLPINGVRLIDRTLTQLSQFHINRVVIVVGYQAQNLINYIGHRYDNQLKIEYVENPIYDKTNNIYSLALVKEQLVQDDTILLESDLIYEDGIFDMIVKNPAKNIALVAKWETWMDGTVVKIDEDYNITEFIGKKAFQYENSDSYYKTINIYKFSKDFSKQKYVPFLNAYCKALGNNEYYEQVLRIITFLNSTDVKALPIGDRKWYEIDDIQDKDIAETIFADDDDLLQKFNKRYGGYWRFPKLLDFCYLVNPFFPSQRMKDEMRANFEILLTEYPSGMHVNSLLAGKYFGVSPQNIVVGNGAAELIKSIMGKLNEKIGIICPTFEEYPNRRDTKDIVFFIPENEAYTYTADDLMNFFRNKNIQTLLLINPDNPSGNFIEKKDVFRLVEWTEKRNIRLIVDESFVDFSDNYATNSLIDDTILQKYKHLCVMKSISKSYGVPGLRLGVLASTDKEFVDFVKKDVSIWNINSFAEFYMQIFNKYSEDYYQACRKFITERKMFEKKLNTIPWLTVFPSQANYFFCKVGTPHTSTELTRRLLLEHNILIKDCNNKKNLSGKNYIRIAIRNREDNEKLIGALKTI